MSVGHFSRRHVLALLAVSAAHAALPGRARARTASLLAELEARHGGRLGVQVLDGDSPLPGLGHRTDERFALCSTFKLLLAAVVLREAARGRLQLDEPLAFGTADLVAHSPVVGAQLERGRLTVVELAEAAQLTSDNAAANLLLRRLGGPAAFTALLREMGDTETRLDRIEPAMNHVEAADLRDTTTPAAMARTVARLFSADLLDEAAQQRLKGWMIATRTGLRRLRGGFPVDWQAGDKTGTAVIAGQPNRHNDVAVVWRPGRAPLVVAAFYEAPGHFPSMRAEDDAVLAEVGRLVGT